MDSFNYWQGRVKNEMLQRQLEEKVLAVEYETMVNYYRSQIEQLIDNFFTRYALGAKVSKAEAKKLVNAFDVEGFAGKAKRYVKEKNFSPRANEELALYNLTMKVNRLELLKANMELELIAMADEEVKMTEQKLKDEYVSQNLKQTELINRYRKQAGILEETVPEPQTLEKMAKAVINTPFKGATWSERIWKRQDALADVVGKLTQDAIFIGHSGDWIKTRLRKEFDVTAYEARRLAVTELARVQTAVQKESYERNDFEKYIYMAEPTACDICAELDGKTFLVKDMTPGKNACPMHPHCKCSSAPDVSDERAELDKLLDERVAERERQSESGNIQYRKNSRIGYLSETETFKRQLATDWVNIKTTKATGTTNDIYISQALKGNRKRPVRYYDKQLTEAYKLMGDLTKGLEKPRLVIVAPSETKKDVIAGYVKSDNAIFVRGDVSTDSAMLDMQTGDLAESDNPLSTVVHELGHWYQYNKQVQQKPDATGEELRIKMYEIDKMIIDTIHNKGYNVNEKLSRYARTSFMEKDYGEVFAEIAVKILIDGDGDLKMLFKGWKP